MNAFPLRFAGVAALLSIVAACHGTDKDADKLAGRDPAVTAALDDPIMSDPDLASQNRGNAALAGGGPPAGEMPLPAHGPEEIAAAKDAAFELAGGHIPTAPAAESTADHSPRDGAVTGPALVDALPGFGGGCGAKMTYTALWAAKLPPAFPVYPRGHVAEVAGADAPGCAVRSVQFLTPVAPGDLIDFYALRAAKAGFSAHHTRAGDDDMLSATHGAARVLLLARARKDGLSDAMLVTFGG